MTNPLPTVPVHAIDPQPDQQFSVSGLSGVERGKLAT